ncbi:hypothetical protein PoB_005727400 [Plakobranchus ocellatus]|uniref:Uncharacterized protein n=1 Tax=Plakobranchus ocellatus TaxID=259542 RepID=A0AAV4CDR7_9GAST|nr:hypothetical protein PoB_005727400 [Plakobranchus ocellatus]
MNTRVIKSLMIDYRGAKCLMVDPLRLGNVHYLGSAYLVTLHTTAICGYWSLAQPLEIGDVLRHIITFYNKSKFDKYCIIIPSSPALLDNTIYQQSGWFERKAFG